MSCPVCRLDACLYNEMASHTPVINKASVEPFMWIRIPVSVARDHELYQVEEILPNTGEVDYFEHIEREYRRPWLRIQSNMLNLSAGRHIYKLSFVNTITDDTITLYLSYTIQDDNPEKPYIYMDRPEEV